MGINAATINDEVMNDLATFRGAVENAVNWLGRSVKVGIDKISAVIVKCWGLIAPLIAKVASGASRFMATSAGWWSCGAIIGIGLGIGLDQESAKAGSQTEAKILRVASLICFIMSGFACRYAFSK